MNAGITRRQALTLGALGIGALAAGATGLVISELGSRVSGSETSTPAPDPSGSMGVTGWSQPSVLESAGGVLDITLEVAEREVPVGGEPVRMLTYNGTVPGPTLHVRPGDLLRVRLQNDLVDPTNLHTHGLLVSASDSGDNPFVRIAPGEGFDYEIQLPDDHPAGVFWYHPHHHGLVADQLFAGLYGALVVDEEDWSQAPPRIAVVSDVTIADGTVVTVSGVDRMRGRTGEVLLVNGQPSPQLHSPAGSQQRLLIVNACASRYLDLRLGGLDALVRGVDSHRRTPQSADRLVLAPGNRADVVITTPGKATDLVAAAYDRGQVGMGMMGGGSAISPESVVLTITADADAPAPAVADAALGARRDLRQSKVDATRTLTMGMGMGGGMSMRFLIDGRTFDPGRTDQSVALGTVEDWTIVNDSAMDHPFHLHVWPMQVLRENGADVTDLVVRDVIDVPARSSVTVRIAFDRFPGRTVYHCHILDHEDLGMMGVIETG